MKASITIAGALVLCGCGASIQAIYEGDVRFERCMAKDARPTVSETTRRACWVEWVTYFTYGQTRDRVLHAQLRIQQLSGRAQQGAEAPLEGVRTGPGPEALSGLPLPQLGKSQPQAACSAECETVLSDCMQVCRAPDAAPTCRPGCEAGLRSCRQQCR